MSFFLFSRDMPKAPKTAIQPIKGILTTQNPTGFSLLPFATEKKAQVVLPAAAPASVGMPPATAPEPAAAPISDVLPVLPPSLEITELASAAPAFPLVREKTKPVIPSVPSGSKVAVPAGPKVDIDTPILSSETYKEGEQSLKKRIVQRMATNPSERPLGKKVDGTRATPVFTPISSPSFRDFIIQAYASYSPDLKRIMDTKDEAVIQTFLQGLKDGNMDASIPKKKVDPDACKTRSSAELDMFYYQKFVRDYLQQSSPYRGLLVYHGLGTGKTCTSIAAAEALYWGNLKRIYVLTPATLSNNYRKDLGKCGYFPLRTKNYWSFLPIPEYGAEYVWLEQKLGLPTSTIARQKGAWIPDPDKPSNWVALTEESRNAIRQQQREHMDHRFSFIHYNGFSIERLATFAEDGVYPKFMTTLEAEYSQFRRGATTKRIMINPDGTLHMFAQNEIRKYVSSPALRNKLQKTVLTDAFLDEIKQEVGSRMFDDSVVIIDEVHNLVRTITGVKIGQLNLAGVIDKLEPHDYNWNTPIRKSTPGFQYPRGYSLYRMLQNAVGCKIVGLSATPMINYAHEMAILMNIIAGEQRAVHIPLRGLNNPNIVPFLQAHPSVDYYNIAKDTNVLTITPVPAGFVKVVEEGVFRGFVRPPPWPEMKDTIFAKHSHQRNLDTWGKSVVADLVSKGFLAAPVETTNHTYPLLPEDQTEFVSNFIDKSTLRIMNPNVLKARTLGYVSYYKGQSEELMPRGIERAVVRVPMSEHMFVEYLRVRNDEIDRDKKKKSTAAPERVGGPINLYENATKVLQTGFMSKSRAACNFTFPEGVVRPVFASLKQEVEVLGLQPSKTIAVNRNEEAEEGGGEGGDVEVEVEALDTEEIEEEAEKTLVKKAPSRAAITGVIQKVMTDLESEDGRYLNDEGLKVLSPKYFVMIENISTSPGPVLVYSQFKTLEGLGIFSSALRISKGYIQLDIVKGAGGVWEITPESMDLTKPRFIIYSGDQDLEKRRLLLQLYNADIAALPARLAQQCTELLQGAPDNRNGQICKAFMITQSGAEGISLMNTRQVHLMEPYWNNVRRQQVIGRAIRLCSHMNLPWDDRVVDVYTYLSVMTPEQKKDTRANMVMKNDGGLTTDEMIYSIAVDKQKLADGLQEILQSAAVDCELHFHEHTANSLPDEITQCFRIGKAGAPAFMTSPDWHDDLLSLQLRGAKGS